MPSAPTQTPVAASAAAAPRAAAERPSERVGVRRRTPKEELAKLHPVERVLLRVFEWTSSIWLAVVLMVWLIVEMTVGTVVESTVNTEAAWFFVYGAGRFKLLLALLAMNIFCAALIRFPWKRYQTGFVVTHLGLLTMIAGSGITAATNVDALMVIRQGETTAHIVTPGEETVTATVADGPDATTQAARVEFGPFTWGHRIFGVLPWRKTETVAGILPRGGDYTQTVSFPSGVTLEVEKFFANCEPEAVYADAGDRPGVAALNYRLYAADPGAGFEHENWLRVDPRVGADQETLAGMIPIKLWSVAGEAELRHFVLGVPEAGPLPASGLLTVSDPAGRVHRFTVDELEQAGRVSLGEDGTQIEFVEYMPNAMPGPGDQGLVNRGDRPGNVTLKLRVLRKGAEAQETYVFGLYPELQAALGRRFDVGLQMSFFPGDQPMGLQMVVGPSGQGGYRAFGAAGILAASFLTAFESYPAFAVPALGEIRFMPLEILANARPALRLREKPISTKADENVKGLVGLARYKGDSQPVTLLMNAVNPTTVELAGESVLLRYGPRGDAIPFELRLDAFEEKKDPGTNKAATFKSFVTVTDPEIDSPFEAQIYMNRPLRHEGADGKEYTFYQSGISYEQADPGGEPTPVTTLTVARDPGRSVIYVGAIIASVGIFLMFYMGGYFKSGKVRLETPRTGTMPA